MKWLPLPENFRERLSAVRAIEATGERAARLVELATCRLGFVESLQVDQVLASTGGATDEVLHPVRLAILASSTVDHLASAIRVAGLRHRLRFDIYVAPYAQYRRTVLDAEGPLHTFRPDFILFSLSARELIGDIALGSSAAEAAQALADRLRGLRETWKHARARPETTIVQQTFLNVFPPTFGSYDLLAPGAPSRLVTQLNEGIADAVRGDEVLLLDIAGASARDGIDFWFDAARWLQARMEIAPQAAAWFGELLARLVAARLGRSRKCLVLDLDNTLWGGVVGDDGIEGIVVGEGSARGEAHLDLQRYARLLRERGVMLAVCSKNELAVAENVFLEHPDMILRRSDFAAFRANWTDKAENLRAIASELNIGLDSLVFVDDNPAERARIRQALPMVAVPELPEDPALYVRCLAAAGYFEAVSFTAEDRSRAAHYQADAQRAAMRESAQSIDDYLVGLDMALEHGPLRPVDLIRAVQLIAKTNQFNATGRKYAADELSALGGPGCGLALRFRLIDRFGDNGLVSVLVLHELADRPGNFVVGNWVMSCRVFGRQLEAESLNIAVEEVRARGGHTLHATYIPTRKNGVINRLFEELGFSRSASPGTDEQGEHWSLNIRDYRPTPTRINRKSS